MPSEVSTRGFWAQATRERRYVSLHIFDRCLRTLDADRIPEKAAKKGSVTASGVLKLTFPLIQKSCTLRIILL